VLKVGKTREDYIRQAVYRALTEDEEQIQARVRIMPVGKHHGDVA
jgi:hypothetical protein